MTNTEPREEHLLLRLCRAIPNLPAFTAWRWSTTTHTSRYGARYMGPGARLPLSETNRSDGRSTGARDHSAE